MTVKEVYQSLKTGDVVGKAAKGVGNVTYLRNGVEVQFLLFPPKHYDTLIEVLPHEPRRSGPDAVRVWEKGRNGKGSRRTYTGENEIKGANIRYLKPRGGGMFGGPVMVELTSEPNRSQYQAKEAEAAKTT